jgi:tryptophanase
MTESLRRDQMAEVGHNPLRLPPASVRYDFFSDVPHRVLVPDGHRTDDAHPDAIAEALAPLTGDARLAFGTKGRAAEHALVEALDLAAPVVLTNGLFTTTAQALAKRNATLEDLPVAREGSSDVDLDHLEHRLAKGGVQLVYLEIANNAWFGWPMSEANVAGARAACDRHGAKLVLDAARPLANTAGDVAAARRILAHAHAFTMSCAKELLVPLGSVVGSTDAALVGRAWQALFKAGTSLSAVDPPQLRADLRDGARYVLDHPELVTERTRLARSIGDALLAAGVPAVQPVTAHGVYVPIDRALLAGDVPALIGVLYHLYAITGIRAQVAMTKKGPTIRLALPLRTALTGDDVRDLATRFAAFHARIAERPLLQMVDGQVDVPYFRRFSAAPS